MFYFLLKVQGFFERLYQSVISLLRIVLRLKFRNSLPKTGTWVDELIILANGPSLNTSLEAYPEEFENKELMAVNQFVLSDQYERLKPRHYTLLDIGFFTSNTIPRVREITEKLIDRFIAKTDWPMTLYFPKEGKNSQLHVSLRASGKPFNFVFFNRTNVDGFQALRHWAYRCNLGMPKPQNVLVGCLMLGLVMRFNKIIIYGADHSWIENIQINDSNELISLEKHFYDAHKKGIPTKREHPETLQQSHLHDYLYDLARTFSSYHLIRRFADAQQAEIINASAISYIDAFDRRK